MSFLKWDNATWWASEQYIAIPGDVIEASIILNRDGQSYTQSITNTRTRDSTSHLQRVERGKGPFSDTYFVVEHQPSSCKELPANGGVVFTNVTISYVGNDQRVHWSAQTWQDVCNCQPSIVGSNTIKFAWNTD